MADDTYSTSIPGADQYAQVEAAAKNAYQQALARLNQKRQQTLNQYGYLGDIDGETGVIGNLRVDPNNPYGQYQTLLHDAAISGQESHDALAGRGIHGGLANQSERNEHYQFGKSSSALGQSLQNLISDFQDSQNQSAQERDRSVADSQLQAARDAIAQRNFDAAMAAQHSDVPDGGGSPGGGVSASSVSGITGDSDYPHLNPSRPDQVWTPVSVGSTTSAEPKPTAGNYIPSPSSGGGNAGGPQVGGAPTGPFSNKLASDTTGGPSYFTYKNDVPLRPGQSLHFKPGRGYYAA